MLEILRYPRNPKTKATRSGTKDGSVLQMATSRVRSSKVMADLLSGCGPAEYEMALRVRVQAGDVRSFTTEAALPFLKE